MEILKKKLNKCDKFTIDVIISFIELNTYHICKQTPSVINKDNQSDIMQFMDGALSRNELLLQFLKDYKWKEQFNDKILNEIRQKKF